MIRSLGNLLLSLTFPQQCRGCSGPVERLKDGVACAGCWEQTHIFNGEDVLCVKCGAFFRARGITQDVRCHKCDEHFYDKAFAVGVYEKALASSLIFLKSEPYICGYLREVIRGALERADLHAVDVVIPVPLSRKRLIERGYNQAELIASIVAKKLSRPIDRGSLGRSRHTPLHRVAMDKKARELTAKRAFSVYRPKLIEGKNIVLVDDIFTSGATTSECSRVLKKNGACSVKVFTAARAVMT